MHLDLTDLRLFLQVHESGTITEGAARSHMTLASASERIRNMEASLGAALLERGRRGVTPTAAGRTLIHHARLVLQQMDRLQGELGDYGRGFKGHVRLLCNGSALGEHLPSVLGGFLASHPGISIDLEERSSDAIADAVRNGLVDLGVVSDLADLSGLECFAFRPDPLVLVVPQDHALASDAAAGLADVVDAPFVGLVAGSALQDHVARQARRLGRQLNYRIRLGSFESVCRVVGAGIGVGIVPRAVASRCARSCKIRSLALTDAWAARRLVLCVRRLAELPAPAQLLARHLLEASPRGRSASARAKP